MDFVEELIDAKLYDLHTAYLAKVLSASETKATIQPLGKTKQYGSAAQAKAPIPNVPVIKSARPVKAGNIVLCVCCERDISQAKKGINSTPAAGHHSLSDSIVVGVL